LLWTPNVASQFFEVAEVQTSDKLKETLNKVLSVDQSFLKFGGRQVCGKFPNFLSKGPH
jgi:hypothetical protein